MALSLITGLLEKHYVRGFGWISSMGYLMYINFHLLIYPFVCLKQGNCAKLLNLMGDLHWKNGSCCIEIVLVNFMLVVSLSYGVCESSIIIQAWTILIQRSVKPLYWGRLGEEAMTVFREQAPKTKTFQLKKLSTDFV